MMHLWVVLFSKGIRNSMLFYSSTHAVDINFRWFLGIIAFKYRYPWVKIEAIILFTGPKGNEERTSGCQVTMIQGAARTF
jgi:hypothetical protein